MPLGYSLLRLPWPLHTRLDALAAALGLDVTDDLDCVGKIDALTFALEAAERELGKRERQNEARTT